MQDDPVLQRFSLTQDDLLGHAIADVLCGRSSPAGFKADVIYNLEGGTDAWIKAGEPADK